MLPKPHCESTGLNSFTLTPTEHGSSFLMGLVDGLNRLAAAGKGMLLAVSGGADSVAMLHGLMEIGDGSHRDKIVVAHLNHCLRGEESDEDARLVEVTCLTLGVPCILEDVAPGSLEVNCRGSLEEAARNVRYEFLARAAASFNLQLIVTAHHQQDQVETLLFNFLRGTGLRGLCGIPECRELVPGVQLIRPMLKLNPQTIRDFLHGRGIQFREDASNATSQFTRNQIRLILNSMPREVSDSLREFLLALSKQADRTMNVIDNLSDRILNGSVLEESDVHVRFDCKSLIPWPEPFVRHALILKWTRKRWPRQQMNTAHWTRLSFAALTGEPRRWTFPGGVSSLVRRRLLTLSFEKASSSE